MNYYSEQNTGQFNSHAPVQYVVVDNPNMRSCSKCGGSGFTYKKGKQKACKKCNRQMKTHKTRCFCICI